MNAFFRYPPNPDIQRNLWRRGSSYVKFSERHQIEGSNGEPVAWAMQLEGFDKGWFDQTTVENPSSSKEEFMNLYYHANIAIIELLLPNGTSTGDNRLDQLITGNTDFDDNRWFQIDLDENGEFELDVYPNLFLDSIPTAYTSFQAVTRNTATKLNNAVSTSFQGDATRQDVSDLLSELDDLSYLVVYDVGQGTAIGLCHHDGSVLAYVDIGGGVTWNKGTFPPSLQQFCFTKDPPIILSHWHSDHYSSALLDTRALSLNWIAPRQSLGAAGAGFLSQILSAGGSIYFLPNTVSAVHCPRLLIERCTGGGLNHSGLSITVYQHANQGDEAILLPGDAKFSTIPSCVGGTSLFSLVASHHGGKCSGSVPIHNGNQNGKIVYSYGSGNGYSHPNPTQIHRYEQAGWTTQRRKRTPDRGVDGLGHIYLGWDNPTNLPSVPCGEQQCQLSPRQ
jgi:hypothetical protein